MKAALLLQPLAVSIRTERKTFFSYSSGIYDGSDCNDPIYDKMENHAMQAVGFGYSGDRPYVILKNSWGATWGEQGGYMNVFVDPNFDPNDTNWDCRVYGYSVQMTVGF